MPIQAKQNLYPGVNAHLNSFLQLDGGDWESFHDRHINDLQEYLDENLPDNYYAIQEKSLQITAITPGFQPTRRTRPDIAIFQSAPGSQRHAPNNGAAAPVATLPLSDILEDDDFSLMSVVIYEVEGGHLPGKPVTRIELLSPSNKPPHADYHQYYARRLRTLRAEVSVVEIDYLHELPPAHPSIPSYADRQANAFPYTIVINKPYPSPPQGVSDFYGIAVDEPLLKIEIPLSHNETVLVDFGAVYKLTFERVKVFHLVVDYAQDPPNFDRYHPEDQTKIRLLLEQIRREHGGV